MLPLEEESLDKKENIANAANWIGIAFYNHIGSLSASGVVPDRNLTVNQRNRAG
jgi:hypothetical protein